MSALDDIGKRLAELPPVKPGWERAVLIGISARRGITASTMLEEPAAKHAWLLDVPLLDTTEEDILGWVIRDMDPKGQWHDAGLDPARNADAG